MPVGNKVSDVLSRILDQVETCEHEVHRVLAVEDSVTAIAHIRRALLQAAADYHPDAILMDMYMPI